MLSDAVDVMLQQVDESVKRIQFTPLIQGIREVFAANGVHLARIQMPMTTPAGFRRPLYWAIIVTWNRESGFSDTFVVRHDERAAWDAEMVEDQQRSVVPYSAIFGDPKGLLRCKLQEDALAFPILETFRDAGLVDYLVFNITVPGLAAAAEEEAELKEAVVDTKPSAGPAGSPFPTTSSL